MTTTMRYLAVTDRYRLKPQLNSIPVYAFYSSWLEQIHLVQTIVIEATIMLPAS